MPNPLIRQDVVVETIHGHVNSGRAAESFKQGVHCGNPHVDFQERQLPGHSQAMRRILVSTRLPS
jgi:hypothetical protein